MKKTKVYKFKTNAWHLKLMKYIWGVDHTEFRTMCGYFQLSILNVIIFPIVFIVKEFVRLLSTIDNMYVDYAIKKETDRLSSLPYVNIEDEDYDMDILEQSYKMYTRYLSIRNSNSSKKRKRSPLYKAISENNELENRLSQNAHAFDTSRYRLKQAKALRKKKFREAVTNVALKIIPVFCTLVVISLGGVVLLTMGSLIYSTITVGEGSNLAIYAFLAFLVIIMFFTVGFASAFIQLINVSEIDSMEDTTFIILLKRGRRSAIDFKDTLIDLKKAHCPMIEWEHEES